jgi:hypothetical protein
MSLDIVKWNPINDEYGGVRASIYVKPTFGLLEFLNRNSGNGNRTVMVRISGTNHPIYDGAPFLAIVDKTSDVANCRQNFYDATGLYILTLSIGWFGYPENLGSFKMLEGILEDTYGNQTQPEKESGSEVVNVADITSSPASPASPSSTPSPSVIKENYSDRYNYEDNEDNDRMMNNKTSKKTVIVLILLVCVILFMIAVSSCGSKYE